MIKEKRKCPVCLSDESNDIKIFTFDTTNYSKKSLNLTKGQSERFIISKCHRCKMKFVSNDFEVDMTNKAYIDLEMDSPEMDTVFPTKKVRNKLKLFILALAKKGIIKGKVLDFGCGYGGFLVTAKELGYDGLGIEPSKYRAQWARNHWGIEVINDFGENINNYKLDQFQFIYSSQVFEHLYNPLDCAQNLFTILEPNGYIWIDTPNYNYKYLGREIMDQTHFNYFTPNSLANLLKNAGLSIVKKQYTPQQSFCSNLIKNIGRPILKLFKFGECNVLAKRN